MCTAMLFDPVEKQKEFEEKMKKYNMDKNGVYTYLELRKRRLHCLDFYDLVEDSKNENDKKYKFKDDFFTYKRGLCSENRKLTLVRLPLTSTP